MTAPVLSLAKKMERALRNGTGFTVTVDEMRAMGEIGVIETVHSAKLKELMAQCPAKLAPMSSENTGSTNVETARPLIPGKSQPISQEAARSYIAALSAGA